MLTYYKCSCGKKYLQKRSLTKHCKLSPWCSSAGEITVPASSDITKKKSQAEDKALKSPEKTESKWVSPRRQPMGEQAVTEKEQQTQPRLETKASKKDESDVEETFRKKPEKETAKEPVEPTAEEISDRDVETIAEIPIKEAEDRDKKPANRARKKAQKGTAEKSKDDRHHKGQTTAETVGNIPSPSKANRALQRLTMDNAIFPKSPEEMADAAERILSSPRSARARLPVANKGTPEPVKITEEIPSEGPEKNTTGVSSTQKMPGKIPKEGTFSTPPEKHAAGMSSPQKIPRELARLSMDNELFPKSPLALAEENMTIRSPPMVSRVIGIAVEPVFGQNFPVVADPLTSSGAENEMTSHVTSSKTAVENNTESDNGETFPKKKKLDLAGKADKKVFKKSVKSSRRKNATPKRTEEMPDFTSPRMSRELQRLSMDNAMYPKSPMEMEHVATRPRAAREVDTPRAKSPNKKVKETPKDVGAEVQVQNEQADRHLGGSEDSGEKRQETKEASSRKSAGEVYIVKAQEQQGDGDIEDTTQVPEPNTEARSRTRAQDDATTVRDTSEENKKRKTKTSHSETKKFKKKQTDDSDNDAQNVTTAQDKETVVQEGKSKENSNSARTDENSEDASPSKNLRSRPKEAVADVPAENRAETKEAEKGENNDAPTKENNATEVVTEELSVQLDEQANEDHEKVSRENQEDTTKTVKGKKTKGKPEMEVEVRADRSDKASEDKNSGEKHSRKPDEEVSGAVSQKRMLRFGKVVNTSATIVSKNLVKKSRKKSSIVRQHRCCCGKEYTSAWCLTRHQKQQLCLQAARKEQTASTSAAVSDAGDAELKSSSVTKGKNIKRKDPNNNKRGRAGVKRPRSPAGTSEDEDRRSFTDTAAKPAEPHVSEGVCNLVCEYCGKSCLLQANWKRHMAVCKQRPKAEESENKRRREVAVSSYQELSVLLTSRVIESSTDTDSDDSSRQMFSGDKPFGCYVCGKRFADKPRYKKHKASACDKKKYQCGICGMYYSSTKLLAFHEVEHVEVDTSHPFGCPVCGQKFKSSSTLLRHRESHSTSKMPPKKKIKVEVIDGTIVVTNPKRKPDKELPSTDTITTCNSVGSKENQAKSPSKASTATGTSAVPQVIGECRVILTAVDTVDEIPQTTTPNVKKKVAISRTLNQKKKITQKRRYFKKKALLSRKAFKHVAPRKFKKTSAKVLEKETRHKKQARSSKQQITPEKENKNETNNLEQKFKLLVNMSKDNILFNENKNECVESKRETRKRKMSISSNKKDGPGKKRRKLIPKRLRKSAALKRTHKKASEIEEEYSAKLDVMEGSNYNLRRRSSGKATTDTEEAGAGDDTDILAKFALLCNNLPDLREEVGGLDNETGVDALKEKVSVGVHHVTLGGVDAVSNLENTLSPAAEITEPVGLVAGSNNVPLGFVQLYNAANGNYHLANMDSAQLAYNSVPAENRPKLKRRKRRQVTETKLDEYLTSHTVFGVLDQENEEEVEMTGGERIKEKLKRMKRRKLASAESTADTVSQESQSICQGATNQLEQQSKVQETLTMSHRDLDEKSACADLNCKSNVFRQQELQATIEGSTDQLEKENDVQEKSMDLDGQSAIADSNCRNKSAINEGSANQEGENTVHALPVNRQDETTTPVSDSDENSTSADVNSICGNKSSPVVQQTLLDDKNSPVRSQNDNCGGEENPNRSLKSPSASSGRVSEDDTRKDFSNKNQACEENSETSNTVGKTDSAQSSCKYVVVALSDSDDVSYFEGQAPETCNKNPDTTASLDPDKATHACQMSAVELDDSETVTSLSESFNPQASEPKSVNNTKSDVESQKPAVDQFDLARQIPPPVQPKVSVSSSSEAPTSVDECDDYSSSSSDSDKTEAFSDDGGIDYSAADQSSNKDTIAVPAAKDQPHSAAAEFDIVTVFVDPEDGQVVPDQIIE